MGRGIGITLTDPSVEYTGTGWTTLNNAKVCAKPGVDAPVLLEDATEVVYGAGKFGLGTVLKKADYYPLVENVDYAYGKRLDASTTQDAVDGFGSTAGGIVDTAASGSLSQLIRLVSNNKNVKDPTGLNLKVYAKDLSVGSNLFPVRDKCYIDPARGTFVLPKPLYWSRCESLADLTAPTISVPGSTPTISNSGSYTYNDGTSGGIYNNSWYRYNDLYYYGHGPWSSSKTGDTYVYPLGSNARNWEKATISMWFYVTNYVASAQWSFTIQDYARNYVEFGDISKIGITMNDVLDMRIYGGVAENICRCYLYISGTEIGYADITRTAWNHIYIIWDKDKGLAGGKSVRVFINGTEILSSTNTLPNLTSYIMWLRAYIYIYASVTGIPIQHNQIWCQAHTYIDNIKMWDHVVSEDPTWESGGTKVEDSLHYIYGSANGYKPVLSGGAGGVGYYKSGGSGTYAKWII